MPNVGGRSFPYTKAGVQAARRATLQQAPRRPRPKMLPPRRPVQRPSRPVGMRPLVNRSVGLAPRPGMQRGRRRR